MWHDEISQLKLKNLDLQDTVEELVTQASINWLEMLYYIKKLSYIYNIHCFSNPQFF